MILAGWLLALLGLAQVVYAGTLPVAQLVQGNRLLGIAPSLVANVDLLAQRSMVHNSGLACFLAGALFLAAAYLKPAPEGVRSRSWALTGALAGWVLTVAAVAGFGWFIYGLEKRGSGELSDQARLKQAQAEASARLLGPNSAAVAAPSNSPPESGEPAD